MLLFLLLVIQPSLGWYGQHRQLEGVHLRIGVNGIPGQLTQSVREEKNGSYSLEGPTRLLLDYVADMGRMSYDIVLVKNAGLETIRDGLVRKKYDFCAIYSPPVYVENMDWSAYIWDEPWRILRPSPKELGRLLAFIRPFQPSVWFYFLGTTAAMITMLSLFAMAYDSKLLTLPANLDRMRRRTFFELCGSYTMLILNVVTNKGGTSMTYASLSFRLLFGLWLLVVVVLVNGFASIVTSSMMLPQMEPVVQNYDDIANERQRGVTIITLQNSSYTKLLLEAKSGLFKAFGDQLRRYPESMATDYIDFFTKLSSGKYALPFMETFLLTFISLNYEKTGKCNFQVTEKLDFMKVANAHGTSLSAYPLQRNGRYNDALNNIFVLLAETGLNEYWIHHSFNNKAYKCLAAMTSKVKVASIRLVDVTSAFFIYGIGTSLSLLCFLLEQLYKKLKDLVLTNNVSRSQHLNLSRITINT